MSGLAKHGQMATFSISISGTAVLHSTTNVRTKDRNNAMSTIPDKRKWTLLQTTCNTPKQA
jgi:hypothetical protein